MRKWGSREVYTRVFTVVRFQFARMAGEVFSAHQVKLDNTMKTKELMGAVLREQGLGFFTAGE